MSKRKIIVEPDPRHGEIGARLRQVSEPVTDFDDDLAQLAADMHETMSEARGIGLAAPQIGILKRLIVIHLPEGYDEEDDTEHTLTLVNPEIVKAGGQAEAVEGCLSFPDLLGFVPRYTWATIRAQDLEGRKVRFKARGALARILQHEIDHLNGILFFDRMEDISKLFYVEDVEEAVESGELEASPATA